MSIDYNGKTFISISNTENGEVNEETRFNYGQEGNIVWADYAGGSIKKGFLIANTDGKGNLHMRYQHINNAGEIMTGRCLSNPEILEDGRIRLYEKWEWTSGDYSKGESIVEETKDSLINNRIKYVHTNIVAWDWKRLSEFYINVFDCRPILPERNLSGEWLDKITKIHNANIKGIHLRLPGYIDGPTLEIFEYDPKNICCSEIRVNKQGLGHIAFHVDNVEDVLKKVTDNGGGQYGELIIKDYEGIGKLKVVYAKDPEDNIIELQNWS